jgi:hypothetical protein
VKARIAYIFSVVLFVSCDKNNNDSTPQVLFDSIPLSKQVVPMVNEISGIADSKAHPGFIWAHEDSGAPPVIYVIGHEGNVLKTMVLENAVNRDWEDMVLAGGKVYLAETGDNAGVFPGYFFYLFPEPAITTDTVQTFETIPFTYPDGSHDAEAFLVDTATSDIFIITKKDSPSRIYKISYPYGATNVAILSGTLGYSGVVSACLSNDGSEIIIKTYGQLYHYKRKAGQSISQALQSEHTQLKYTAEPQGEAISFAADNSGFYTLSEKGFAGFVNLNFYKRK